MFLQHLPRTCDVSLANVKPRLHVHELTHLERGLCIPIAIYVSSSTIHGVQTVYEFASSTSGNVTATNTVTLGGWYDSPLSRIAVH